MLTTGAVLSGVFWVVQSRFGAFGWVVAIPTVSVLLVGIFPQMTEHLARSAREHHWSVVMVSAMIGGGVGLSVVLRSALFEEGSAALVDARIVGAVTVGIALFAVLCASVLRVCPRLYPSGWMLASTVLWVATLSLPILMAFYTHTLVNSIFPGLS